MRNRQRLALPGVCRSYSIFGNGRGGCPMPCALRRSDRKKTRDQLQISDGNLFGRIPDRDVVSISASSNLDRALIDRIGTAFRAAVAGARHRPGGAHRRPCTGPLVSGSPENGSSRTHPAYCTECPTRRSARATWEHGRGIRGRRFGTRLRGARGRRLYQRSHHR